jgi:hypothetical protein
MVSAAWKAEPERQSHFVKVNDVCRAHAKKIRALVRVCDVMEFCRSIFERFNTLQLANSLSRSCGCALQPRGVSRAA